MGFWSELKELGKDIGSEFATLGGDLKEIGKKTAEEIKQDPKKFLAESAKDVANVAVSAGKFAFNEVIPRMTSQLEKEMEKRYQANELPPENRKSYEESRRNTLTKSKELLQHLISNPPPSTEDDLEKTMRRIEKETDRLAWYVKLPNLGVEESVIADAKQLIFCAEQHIKDLKASN